MESAISFRERSLAGLNGNDWVKLQGELYKKEIRNQQYLYYLRNCYYLKSDSGKSKQSIPCNQVIVYVTSDEDSIGEILCLSGQLNEFEEARNEGNFDTKSYYAYNGIDFEMQNPSLLFKKGKKNVFLEWLWDLRNRMREVYQANLEEEEAGVIATMVLGDRSLLQSQIKNLYKEIGISHVLSISGLHVSLLGLSLYHILRKLGARYKGSAAIAASVIAIYCIFTGEGVSTQRAVVMLWLVMLADCLGRVTDLLTSLSLVAFALLMEQPFWICYSGFLLSFLAVIGAGVAGPVLIRYVSNCHGLNKLAKAFIFNVGIQGTTLGMVAYLFYEIPLYGFISNLILIPLAGTLLFVGMLGGLTGLSAWGFWQMVSRVSFLLCHLILNFYQNVGNLLISLPYSSFITGCPKQSRLLLYFAIWFMGLYYFFCHTSDEKKEKGRRLRRKYCQVAGWLGLLFLIIAIPAKRTCEIDVLDVGQGDGIYLQMESGIRLFIDGGSTSSKQIGTYRILPFLKYKNAKSIDYWVVSHCDQDHISGLEEILQSGYPVRHLLLSKEIMEEEKALELSQLAQSNGTAVIWVEAGDSLQFQNGSMTCLFPTRAFKESLEEEDSNAMSLSYYLELKTFRGIFCGDLNELGEEALLRECQKREISLEHLDFYKVNHHGSKTSSCQNFLSVIRPDFATISYGINNNYGHPAPETIKRLENFSSAIYETAKQGEIRIILSKKEYEIIPYLSSDMIQ